MNNDFITLQQKNDFPPKREYVYSVQLSYSKNIFYCYDIDLLEKAIHTSLLDNCSIDKDKYVNDIRCYIA